MTIEQHPKVDRFPAVDGLRAVGAIAVLLTHVGFQTGMYPRGTFGSMLSRMDVGVAIFFVVSGFLLTLGFIRPLAEGRKPPRIVDYAIKRVLRIWPAVIVTIVVVYFAFEPPLSSDRIIGLLTMTTLFGDKYFANGISQMWSLETEVAFYLALPVLMAVIALVSRRSVLRSTAILGASMIVANVVWVLYAADIVSRHFPFANQWIFSYLAWFGAGLILAAMWVANTNGASGPWLRALETAGAMPGACWTVALATLLIASSPLAGPLDLSPGATPSTALFKCLAYLVVGVCLVVPAIFGPRTSYRTFLEHPVMRYLGQISYGLFCIHLAVLHLAFTWTSSEIFSGRFWLILPITLVVSIAAAAVLHHVVERPAIRLAGRLTRRPQPTSEPNATTPSARS